MPPQIDQTAKIDYIFNGVGSGSVAQKLLKSNFDLGVLRPWEGKDGATYIAVTNDEGKQQTLCIAPPAPKIPGLTGNVANLVSGSTGALLRKDEWIEWDNEVVGILQPRMRMFNDLRSRNQYVIPNGMAKTMIQSQGMTHAGNATISMSGLRKADRDRPTFDLRNFPLPIIHSDFSFDLREVLVSRNSNTPLDTTMLRNSAYECAVAVEKLTAGVSSTYSYGGATIYGFCNYPDRITFTLTNPTAGGWTAATTVNEILNMVQAASLKFLYGPWRAYYSPNWQRFLSADYNSTRGNSLMQRLREVTAISSWEQSDYLTGYQILLVDDRAETARAVVGMEFQTIQWQEQGGMELNFKLMGIMVPQLRSDVNGTTGIVHGTAP